jgi:hypothetical protein
MPPPLNARTFVSPRRTSQLLFAPRHAPDDRAIAWISVARTLVAIAVWAALASQRNLNNLVIAGSQPLVSAVRTLYLGPVIVVVVVLGALLRDRRWNAVKAAARGPLLTIIVAIIIMLLVVWDNRYGLGRVQHWPSPGNLTANAKPAVVAATVERLALELVYVWLGVYVICALYYMNRNMFNAADVDPRLVPIAAIMFVWTLVIYDSSPALQRVIPQLHMGVPVPMNSNALRAVLAVGGAATVTVLAAWELARIRRQTAAETYPILPTGYSSPSQAPYRRRNLP